MHRLYKIITTIVLDFKISYFLRYKNSHDPHHTAVKRKLTKNRKAYLRNTFSDIYRIKEFRDSIYTLNGNILFQKLEKLPLSLIVDVGANIGLSSLALSDNFTSATNVVGIEMENENFLILSRNYEFWQKTYHPNSRFIPFFKIASSKILDKDSISFSRIEGGKSSSGTFNISTSSNNSSNKESCSDIIFSKETISINEIFDKFLPLNSYGVVKVDIEGGEGFLFEESLNWLSKTAFLTIEMHDSMADIYGSVNVLKALVEYNFAIVPDEDVLHCFNRNLLLE